ncbi:hypothetical protein P43SY_000760 [Pythium insidiosum]|uniref:Uncharacterized protein n=1 Tax=Pythium insidiosum TaxID=114742 RepID=A0AAD5Q4B9_PYTIN|nr:hypothetical protein P43SY_000760 [Pythium insidiosum]
MSLQLLNDTNVVPILLSVYIATHWSSGKEELHVENNCDDVSFTFTCDQGIHILEPHAKWSHKFSSGSRAMKTMKSVAIIEARHRGRQLTADETHLVFKRNDVSWTVKVEKWARENPGTVIRLALGDPSEILSDPSAFFG